MNWNPNWYLLPNGHAIALDECRVCSCGEPTKVITNDAASCPACKAKDLRGKPVLARLNCLSGVVTEASGRISHGIKG